MSFIETRIDDSISLGSAGGPRYSTEIVTTASGYETRQRNWTYPRYVYNIAYGVKTRAQMETLQATFNAAGGSFDGFRMKDWSDFKSCALDSTVADTDQTIGTGDASEVDFQLIKTYTFGANSQVRQIKKPVSGTVVISLDDVPQASGWTVDTTTGIVTFSSPPGASVVVKAGYEFDVPVRFASDAWQWTYEDFNALTADVELIELRL